VSKNDTCTFIYLLLPINLFILLLGTDYPIKYEETVLDTNSDDEFENNEIIKDLSYSNVVEFLQR